MNTNPSLLFAALRRDTADHYLAELREIFQDDVTLSAHIFEESAVLPSDGSAFTAVLAAGPASHARCVGFFPAEKLLLFERDVSFPYQLDQVFLLAPGTRVLVVSELEVGALEVIDQLQSRGVDHVTYVPYWEGCGTDTGGISVALSPGMFQFCPPGIAQRIDIRRRHLSVGTFITLLQRLGFDFSYLERLMAYHSRLLFQTYWRLSDQRSRTLRLQKPLEGKPARHHFTDIIAASPSMQRVMDSAREMARSPLGASILITGESGTGKELFAQAIHNASDRAGYPFVPVNFGAIPENLVESELFGYESGAFTGASKTGKQGLFEIARHGTIFLDEIGDASPYIQARLLRVLEERDLMRLGGTRTIPVDVRVIAATNRDLQEMCRTGAFRMDLYHRLNTFPLKIPPLRERRECLEAMLTHFQSFYLRKREFSPDALRCIYHYPWPGNARELKNLIDFLTLKPGLDPIAFDDLPFDLKSAYREDQDRDVVLNVLPALREYAPLETVAAFLSLVGAHAGRPLGRTRLVAKLAERGLCLSDARCRSLIDLLVKLGLLEKGKTKQGTWLTEKGKDVLDNLRRNAV